MKKVKRKVTKRKIVKKVTKRKVATKKVKRVRKVRTESDLKRIDTKCRLFKVLMPYGNKLTGGNAHHFDWTPYLPSKDGTPGKLNITNTSKRQLHMCSHGLHVTSNPNHWNGSKSYPNNRVFEVEVYGNVLGLVNGKPDHNDSGRKICVEAVRLVREIIPPKPGQSEYDIVTDSSFQW